MKKMTLVFVGALLLICCLTAAGMAATFTVTNDSDENVSGSLRYAILQANTVSNEESEISVNADVKLIKLSNELSISSPLTLKGNGVTLQGGSTRILSITGGTPHLEKVTFIGGDAQSGNGGAVSVESNAAATFTNCTFFGNKAGTLGGAVYINSSNTASNTAFVNCTIAGNEAARGGGVAVANGSASFVASIVAGNTGGADVDCETTATIVNTGKYNVIGNTNSSSFSSAQKNLTGVSAVDVFLTNPLSLETVNGVQVLRLSPASTALDLIPKEETGLPDVDERGLARPQLLGYDAGAFEAEPVAVQSIQLEGSPYIQLNMSEDYTVTTTPVDASRNKNYPEGIEWSVSDPSVISVDKGVVKALAVGTATLSATLHGWNATNQEITVGPSVIQIYVGKDPLPIPALSLDAIPNQSIQVGQTTTVPTKVTIVLPAAGTDILVSLPYTLHVSSPSYEAGTAEVSGDQIVLKGVAAGSADIAVTATAKNKAGTGTSPAQHFTLTVSQGSTSSKGGGGCDAGIGAAALLALAGTALLRKRGR